MSRRPTCRRLPPRRKEQNSHGRDTNPELQVDEAGHRRRLFDLGQCSQYNLRRHRFRRLTQINSKRADWLDCHVCWIQPASPDGCGASDRFMPIPTFLTLCRWSEPRLSGQRWIAHSIAEPRWPRSRRLRRRRLGDGGDGKRGQPHSALLRSAVHTNHYAYCGMTYTIIITGRTQHVHAAWQNPHSRMPFIRTRTIARTTQTAGHGVSASASWDAHSHTVALITGLQAAACQADPLLARRFPFRAAI